MSYEEKKKRLLDVLTLKNKEDIKLTEELLERKPPTEEQIKKLESLFKPRPDRFYPEGIYIEIHRNKTYSSRSPYKIYRVTINAPLPENIFISIVNIVHSFNMDKVYWRNKVNGDFSWDDFEENLKDLVKRYRKQIEVILEKAGWKAEHAPLFVPLLYNIRDPVFDENIYIFKDFPGHSFRKTITPSITTSGSGRRRQPFGRVRRTKKKKYK